MIDERNNFIQNVSTPECTNTQRRLVERQKRARQKERKMKNRWFAEIERELQLAADRKNSKLIKKLIGSMKQSIISFPLKGSLCVTHSPIRQVSSMERTSTQIYSISHQKLLRQCERSFNNCRFSTNF